MFTNHQEYTYLVSQQYITNYVTFLSNTKLQKHIKLVSLDTMFIAKLF